MTGISDSKPDQRSVPDSSWRALARATYDQAVEIMENPPTLGTMRDLFDHRLGTYGQAYEVMNLGEAYAEIERLRKALATVASGYCADPVEYAKSRLASDDNLAACPDCEGTGHGEALGDGSGYVPCGTCNGTGKIDAEDARRYRENRARAFREQRLADQEER